MRRRSGRCGHTMVACGGPCPFFRATTVVFIYLVLHLSSVTIGEKQRKRCTITSASSRLVFDVCVFVLWSIESKFYPDITHSCSDNLYYLHPTYIFMINLLHVPIVSFSYVEYSKLELFVPPPHPRVKCVGRAKSKNNIDEKHLRTHEMESS